MQVHGRPTAAVPPAAHDSAPRTEVDGQRGAEQPAADFTEHAGRRQLEHRALLVAVSRPSDAHRPDSEHDDSVGADNDSGNETLVGWVDCGVDPAHVGTGRQSLGSPELQLPRRGMIRWMWFVPGQRRAGEALITAAEAHLAQHMGTGGLEEVLAFDDGQTYHFYQIGHAYLSDRANHIHALLEGRGFRRYESELFYAWRNFAISDEDVEEAKGKCRGETDGAHGDSLQVDISFQAIPGQGERPNAILKLIRGTEVVGICECLSGGERVSHSSAQDWFLISWLGVPPNPKPRDTSSSTAGTAGGSTREERALSSNESYAKHAFQGRGLGKLALTAAMYYMQRRLGYVHAAISTRGIVTDLSGPNDTNSRAQSFYSNFGGFTVEDFTYGLRREEPMAAPEVASL